MANSDIATVIDVIATSNVKFSVKENSSGGLTEILSKKPKRIPEKEVKRALSLTIES